MNRGRLWIYGLALIGFLVWVTYTSPDLQECFAKQRDSYLNQSPQNYVSSLFVLLGAPRPCVGEFVHNNGEAIIALFTVILALATILLWLATQNLLIAADKTSRKQLRAYVHLSGVYLVRQSQDRFYAIAKIKNYGQTPARKIIITYNNLVYADLPESDKNLAPLSDRPYDDIAPGQQRRLIPASVTLDSDKRQKVLKKIGAIFLCGYLNYEDVFGETHTLNFRRYASNIPPVAPQPKRLFAVPKSGFVQMAASKDGNGPGDNKKKRQSLPFKHLFKTVKRLVGFAP